VKLRVASMMALCVLPVGACSGLYGDDELARYVQRSDKVTLSAGDAKSVNAATHVLDPWPPGINDRRIPADGARMVRAIERYRRGPAQPLLPSSSPVGSAPAAGPGAAPAAGAVPEPVPGADAGQAPPALGSQ
jgi:hypothetical protein